MYNGLLNVNGYLEQIWATTSKLPTFTSHVVDTQDCPVRQERMP